MLYRYSLVVVFLRIFLSLVKFILKRRIVSVNNACPCISNVSVYLTSICLSASASLVNCRWRHLYNPVIRPPRPAISAHMPPSHTCRLFIPRTNTITYSITILIFTQRWRPKTELDVNKTQYGSGHYSGVHRSRKILRYVRLVALRSYPAVPSKALSTLSQKSETIAEFGDSLTFLRQCGQGLTQTMWGHVSSFCKVRVQLTTFVGQSVIQDATLSQGRPRDAPYVSKS